MQLQTDYLVAYRSMKLTRDGSGVLVVEFHSKGGPSLSRHKIIRSLSMPFTELDKTERTRSSSLQAGAGISSGT